MKRASLHKMQAAAAPPKWPDLGFVDKHLELQTLLHDQILTVSGLFTAKLCRTYVDFLASLPLQTTTPGKRTRGEAVRVNDRYQINDPDFAATLWSSTALQHLIEQPEIDGKALGEAERLALWGGEVLGLNPNIRIYRYRPGQHFAQHYDESNNVTVNEQPAKTTWTLLLYLTSQATGCEGGQTVFYPEARSKRGVPPPPVVAELEVGMGKNV